MSSPKEKNIAPSLWVSTPPPPYRPLGEMVKEVRDSKGMGYGKDVILLIALVTSY